ncbi:MAG: DUF255 domain-containing protein [Fimbriimonadaceae bacterium]|nr:DUF255 domain-containing protein [Fimbriimonadaceae bacterium]
MMAQRPSFRVVTYVLATLVVVGLVMSRLEAGSGGDEPNELRSATEPYLRQAADQRVHWHRLSPALFEQARRLDRMVLVVVGNAWSRAGRIADDIVFRDLELRVYLNRNYLCARVDMAEQPEWGAFVYPLSRAEMRFQYDLQMLVFEPDGKLFRTILRKHREEPLEPIHIRGRLQEFRRELERKRRLDPAIVSAHARQQDDLDRLESAVSTTGTIPFFGHTEALVRSANRRFGGFPVRNEPTVIPSFQPLLPAAWRFLLLTGRYDEFRTTLDPALRSHVVDWVDGGFFKQAALLNWVGVELDKPAVENAEMMAMLAQAARVLREPAYDTFAESAWFTLTRRFWTTEDLVPAARVGDEGYRERSRRSSFGPRRLAQTLEPPKERWAVAHLGMVVENNVQMLVRVSDWGMLRASSPEFREVLSQLRAEASKEPETYAGYGYTDVNATVVARMLDTARLWGRPEPMDQACRLYEALRNRLGPDADVPHRFLEPRTPGRLNDHLAWADACLAYYVARGDVAALNAGRRALARAIERFRTRSPFVLGVAVGEASAAIDLNVPEVADAFGESGAAKAIRLAHAYGFLTLGSKGETLAGAALMTWASTSAHHLTSLGVGLAPMTTALFCAALQTEENTYLVWTGPHAVAEAGRLAARSPNRSVFPIVPGVRPDLAAARPGPYVSERNRVLPLESP